MLLPTIRRRHSDAGPIRPVDITALKNTPLPEIPSLGMLKKERDGLASTRAFNTQEIVDEILAYLQPKEIIKLQHLNETCSRAVENNSTIVKMSENDIGRTNGWGKPIYTRYTTMPLGWDVDLDEVDLEEVPIPEEALAHPSVPWDQILGWEWQPDRPSPSLAWSVEYSLVAGNVFDSFVIDLRDLSRFPFSNLPRKSWTALLDMTRSRQMKSCFLDLHYAVEDWSLHKCDNHPIHRRSSHWHELHVRAELDPSKPEEWFRAVDACTSRVPLLDDVFKYDLDHTQPTKHLRLNKCEFGLQEQQVLVSGVDYTWILSR